MCAHASIGSRVRHFSAYGPLTSQDDETQFQVQRGIQATVINKDFRNKNIFYQKNNTPSFWNKHIFRLRLGMSLSLIKFEYSNIVEFSLVTQTRTPEIDLLNERFDMV